MQKKNKLAKDHECPHNFTGSSKSMEASAGLQITENIFNNSEGRVYLEYIVSDDDSTMRGVLKYPKMKKNHLMNR